jgi:hypothetical protein
VHVVHPSREGDQLRGLLLTLIRQALAPLVHQKVAARLLCLAVGHAGDPAPFFTHAY